MTTPLGIYRSILGERFSAARLGANAALEPGEIARLREALLEHYAEAAPPRPLASGELRAGVDLPAPLDLSAPPEHALATVFDPMALRREVMARPLKTAILAATRVVLADPVARLLDPGRKRAADAAQVIAALGLLAQLAPLIEEGVLLLAPPALAARGAPDAELQALAHWAVDAAALRQRPGWRAIKAQRDAAFDRFAAAQETGRLLGALDQAAALGAPAHAFIADARQERLSAAMLGDLFWALTHYDLADIDASVLAPLDPELLESRRRDGAALAAEPVCGANEAPFGHVARLVSALWPAASAVALEDVVAMRLGEEAYEEWREFLAAWFADVAARGGEMADPRAPASDEIRDRLADWERRGRARLGRLSIGKAIEKARETGEALAVGAPLAGTPDSVGQAVAAAQGGASGLSTALLRAVLGARPAGDGAPEGPAVAHGLYLAATRDIPR